MLNTHRAQFLKLVSERELIPSLKTFNDTVLFYYLGRLACEQSTGQLLEIGTGGSTYPLLELSSDFEREFTLIDYNQLVVDSITTKRAVKHFAKARTNVLIQDSVKLTTTDAIAYAHIDGSKNYRIALHDLEFSTANLAPNGLICQDDYGNNKWATVTDAVYTMINNKQLQMLFVGDSSAWLTRPEYYEHWMSVLRTDTEFAALGPFLNIADSAVQEKYPGYFFMQSLMTPKPENISEEMFDYYDQLLSFNSEQYLQMPYAEQSAPAYHFRRVNNGFALSLNWHELRGDSWPKDPPQTREEIDQLPESVRNELINVHHITDLYAQVQHSLSPRCRRL